MKRVFKMIIEAIGFALGVHPEGEKKFIDDGLLDFAGQGRDSYGH